MAAVDYTKMPQDAVAAANAGTGYHQKCSDRAIVDAARTHRAASDAAIAAAAPIRAERPAAGTAPNWFVPPNGNVAGARGSALDCGLM